MDNFYLVEDPREMIEDYYPKVIGLWVKGLTKNNNIKYTKKMNGSYIIATICKKTYFKKYNNDDNCTFLVNSSDIGKERLFVDFDSSEMEKAFDKVEDMINKKIFDGIAHREKVNHQKLNF